MVLKNYGMAGAISVIIFIMTGVLGGVVYKMLSAQYKEKTSAPKYHRKLQRGKEA